MSFGKLGAMGRGFGHMGNVLGRAGTSTPTVALKPVSNQVSTRNFGVANSSANRQNNRKQHRLTTNLSSAGLVLRYPSFFFQAGAAGDILQNATTKTVEQVWIEYPTGVMTQGTVVGTGATSFVLTNDYNSVVDVYFPIKPAKGDIFVEQNSVQIAGSNTFEAPITTHPGDYCTYSAVSGGSSKAQYPAGDPSAIAGSVGGGQAWGASVVLGYSNAPAFILGPGDSIADGAGGDQTIGIVENPGNIARFLENNYGFYRVTCPSSGIVSGTAAFNILNLARGSCKYGVPEEGINGVLGGNSLALMQFQYANMCKNLRQAGNRKLIGFTLLPNTAATPVTSLTSVGTTATATVADTSKMTNGMNATIAGAAPSAYNGTYAITITSSTTFTYTFAGGTSPATGTITAGDAWGSYGLQAYASQTSAAKEAVRVAFNSWLTSTNAGGALDAVFDYATFATDPANPALWPTLAYMQSTGATGSQAPTLDGTHPTTTLNDWAFQRGKTTFEGIIATLEAANSDPTGLGTTIKTTYATPTKKTAQFTIASTGIPTDWQTWDGATSLSLTDQSTNTSSGWTLSRGAQAWASASSGNNTYDIGNYHAFPDSVCNNFERVSATPVVMTVAGLNPAKTYNFYYLGGVNGANSNPQVTISGLSAGTPTTITAGQVVNTVSTGNLDPTSFLNVAPDASGNITVSVVRASGQTVGVFNALKIEEN